MTQFARIFTTIVSMGIIMALLFVATGIIHDNLIKCYEPKFTVGEKLSVANEKMESYLGVHLDECYFQNCEQRSGKIYFHTPGMAIIYWKIGGLIIPLRFKIK